MSSPNSEIANTDNLTLWTIGVIVILCLLLAGFLYLF